MLVKFSDLKIHIISNQRNILIEPMRLNFWRVLCSTVQTWSFLFTTLVQFNFQLIVGEEFIKQNQKTKQKMKREK
jgi:hypothetical protein